MEQEKIIETAFLITYGEKPAYMIDTGGRLEICGNHTDHNHGLCLVANCSLRIRAALNLTSDGTINITTVGYEPFKFNITDLEAKEEERGTPKAICKGVVARLKELGYKIGGFKAYIDSEIPNGSGVSSSAAIESLFGYIVSYLYNDGKIPQIDIAKTGQYSENVYFYKPCGLLDQIGTSFDSSNFINFKNIDEPLIETLPFNLPVSIYLIKSTGDHSNLTHLYKAIPDSMHEVAKLLEGKEVLADVIPENIFERIDALNVNDEVKRKAKHFFIENENVLKAKDAILNNDLDAFFDVIRSSQESSKTNLENTYVKGEYEESPQNIIDNVNKVITKEMGAIRIHGGGFKGTVIAFIKNEYSKEFEDYLNKNYKDRYFKVTIPSKAVNFKKI